MNSPMPINQLKQDALESWHAGIKELEQVSSLRSLIYAEPGVLRWAEHTLFYGVNRLHVLALGKSSDHLARAASQQLGDAVERGFAVTLSGRSIGAHWTVFRGGHPLATIESLSAGEALIEWLGRLEPSDHLLVLMSGGASAMVESPAPGWTLESIAQARNTDLISGLAIEQINQRAARRSLLKDGGLARLTTCPWQQITLNDVADAHNGYVSSGPFLGLKGHGLTLADHRTAARSSAQVLTDKGYRVWQAPTLKGEARRQGARLSIPAGYNALVASGETTVEGPYHGRGGRNLELVGGWILDGKHDEAWALVCGAADGCDGDSGAAGAFYDSGEAGGLESLRRAMTDHATANWFAERSRLIGRFEPAAHTGDLLVLLTSQSS